MVCGPCQGRDSAGTGYTAWPQSVQSVQKHWKLNSCSYVDQTVSEIPAAVSDNETNDPSVQDVHHSSPNDNSCNLPNNTQVNIQSDSTTLNAIVLH